MNVKTVETCNYRVFAIRVNDDYTPRRSACNTWITRTNEKLIRKWSRLIRVPWRSVSADLLSKCPYTPRTDSQFFIQ